MQRKDYTSIRIEQINMSTSTQHIGCYNYSISMHNAVKSIPTLGLNAMASYYQLYFPL